MVIPANTYLSNDMGEKYIWDIFHEYEYDDLTTFHSLNMSWGKCQFIGMKRSGLAVGSVFSYKAAEIKKLEKKHLKLTNGLVVNSPVTTLMVQRDKIIAEIKDMIKKDISGYLSILIFCPFMSLDEIKKIGLCDYVPEKFFIPREVLEDKNELAETLNILFQELRVSGEPIKESNHQAIDEFFRGFFPGEELASEEVLEMELQIVSKKELYYEILSFLLMNDITSGHILSCEKWMLDGLAEYMSDRHIPWHYEGNDGGGYELKDENFDTRNSDKDIVIERISRSTYKISVGRKLHLPIEIYEPPKEDFDIDQIPLHLKNEQIREVFLKTFDVANNEIDIISPWMNFYAVDEELIEKMETALKKGVKIKVIYGLKDNNESFEKNRSYRSDQVAEHLMSRFSQYGSLFQIHRDNIHYKLVLCDELYKLEGGFNYLSFEGDYSKADVRKEGSPFGRDIKEIKLLRKEYFSDGWDE